MRREDVYRGVMAVSELGKKFGVDSTPTLFVNGKRYPGAMSIEEFDKILAPFLGGAP